MATVLVLVYLAGVSEALQIIAGCALSIAAIGGVMGAMFCSLQLENMAPYWKAVKVARPYVIVVALLAILMPSKQLLYVAAGMKAGGEIAESSIAQKAYAVLDKQLDALLTEPSK